MSLERFEWSPPRALAIYAHPGDVDISCGGTLARWADAGTEVHVVICARGDKGSNDPALSEETLSALRASEVVASSEVLGVLETHRLSGSDGELENGAELRAELVALVRSVRPQVLVCPDPTAVFFGEHYYNHRDHRVVGWASLDAASPAAAMARYFPAVGKAHVVELALLSGSLEPNVYVDIDVTIERKAAAVALHESQFAGGAEDLGTVVHERAAEMGANVGSSYAEAFRRVYLHH